MPEKLSHKWRINNEISHERSKAFNKENGIEAGYRFSHMEAGLLRKTSNLTLDMSYAILNKTEEKDYGFIKQSKWRDSLQ